jgi:hypothetical protein
LKTERMCPQVNLNISALGQMQIGMVTLWNWIS